MGSDEFHVVDIEVLGNSVSSTTTLETLPQSYQPVLENARVRVSRITLNARQSSSEGSKLTSAGLLIVIAGSRLGIASDSAPMQPSDVTPGQFYVLTELAAQRIYNEGDNQLELISIELK